MVSWWWFDGDLIVIQWGFAGDSLPNGDSLISNPIHGEDDDPL